MSHRRRTGFTLVELLVVVTIIAILAAILVPVVYTALGSAQDAAITVELSNIEAALKQYKTTIHGYAYPPNFTGPAFGGSSPWSTVPAAVVAHIQQKFGRLNVNVATPPPDTLDPAEALVFWLQGYGPNPIDPLSGVRKPVYTGFDETRLVDNGDGDGFPVYYPTNAQKIPYIYFHHDSYASASYGSGTNELAVGGVARPYLSSVTGVFVNPDSYQIISAGQDGDWGTDTGSPDKQFPSGLNYGTGDNDNVTNFSGGTLGKQIP